MMWVRYNCCVLHNLHNAVLCIFCCRVFPWLKSLLGVPNGEQESLLGVYLTVRKTARCTRVAKLFQYTLLSSPPHPFFPSLPPLPHTCTQHTSCTQWLPGKMALLHLPRQFICTRWHELQPRGPATVLPQVRLLLYFKPSCLPVLLSEQRGGQPNPICPTLSWGPAKLQALWHFLSLFPLQPDQRGGREDLHVYRGRCSHLWGRFDQSYHPCQEEHLLRTRR